MKGLQVCLFTFCVIGATLAAPARVNPRTTPKTTRATTTKPPTAEDICAGDKLTGQLALVCKTLREQQAAEKKAAEMAARRACADIIEPQLNAICVELEMSKLTGDGPATAEERTRAPPTTTTKTTPKPATGVTIATRTTFTPPTTTTSGSSRLVDFFNGVFGTGEGSIDVDRIAQDIGQRARDSFDRLTDGTVFENVDLGEVASNLNRGGLSDIFSRLSGSNVATQLRPVLANDALSTNQMADSIRRVFGNSGFDLSKFQLNNNALVNALQSALNSRAPLMADGLSNSASGLDSILSSSTAGTQMMSWARQLVQIWNANRDGLLALPRGDLMSILNAATPTTTAAPQSAEAATTRARGSGALGSATPATTPPSPLSAVTDSLTQLAPIGRINPVTLDSLITQEVKNQALAGVFANVSRNLIGK